MSAAEDVRRVAVIGAGTMGHGIAQVCAQAGAEVVLQDPAPEALDRALRQIRGHLDKGVELGKVDPAVRERVLEDVGTESDLPTAVRDADLVIEAVPESLDLKRRIFHEVEAAAPPHALLATNTSSLGIDRISEGLRFRERFCGMHFFNPVHLMKLVEVVRGSATAPGTVERATRFARRLGKEPIVVRDSPGFASSRLGLVLGLEAIRMLEQGVASAEDIDRAMELGYRHPMGPLRLTDHVGLDVRLDIAEHLHETLGSEAFRPPDLLRRMVEEGRTGRKAGRGFYDWSEGGDGG